MGAEWADTGWWTRTATDGMVGVLAFPAAATTPDRWGAVRKLRRPKATWSISNQDSSAEQTLPRRPGHRRDQIGAG